MAYLLHVIFAVQVAVLHGHNESSPCPTVWMEYELNHWSCQIIDRGVCNDDSLVVQIPHCIGFDSRMQQLVTGYCPYTYYQIESTKLLNASVTYAQLNEVVCGPLNRTGLFCSECKPGYGIPVFSKGADECVLCDSNYSWPLYLTLVLLPITLFYFLVIIFNFSATHPPITAYTFYCQLFIQLVYNVKFIKHHFDTNTDKTFQILTWTVNAAWNLDLFRYIIPSFCLEEWFTTIDAILLELIAALYPLLLIFLTFVLIEMHAHNIRVIVFLWKPFHKCFTCVRRAWDPRSSVTNAFATFLLLSSFKVCFISFKIAYKMKLYLENNTELHDSVLYNDPTRFFKSISRETYFAPLLILNFLVVILPIFLLALYPTRLWRRITLKLPGRMNNAFHIFMECFQGHYKNGTTGTYDYRAVSCFGFALRFLVGVILTSPWTGDGLSRNGAVTNVAFLLIAVSLFYAHVQPCKLQYMNVIESLLYCIAAVLLIAIIHNNHFPPLFHIILTMILMPSAAFVGIVLYKVSNVLGIVPKIKRAFLNFRTSQRSDIDESEPHRLTHPTHYTPLLGNYRQH